ncbi:MAG: sensor histidine kinase [bacterium]
MTGDRTGNKAAELKQLQAALSAAKAESEETARAIRDYQDQLRRLAAELSLTEARERRAIAADLHDHVGQALAFINVKLKQLQGNSVFCGFESDLTDILTLLQQTIRYTRDLTVEISPPVLFELGLLPALEWLGEETERKFGVKTKVIEVGNRCELDEDLKIILFKAAQELTANVIKHAKASRLSYHAHWLDDELTLKVEDNGQGFAAADANRVTPASDRFGLFSIRERLTSVNGSMQIESSRRHGTSVTLLVPLKTEPST